MDLLFPGLKGARSTRTLRQTIDVINTHSVLSQKFQGDFDEVIEKFNHFLADDLTKWNGNVADVYYALGLDNFHLSKVALIPVAELFKLYGEVISSVERNNNRNSREVEKLLEVMDLLMVLILRLKVSNTYILQSLMLKSQLIYWEDIRNSTRNKLLYTVQTSPLRIWNWLKVVYSHVVPHVNNFGTGIRNCQLHDLSTDVYQVGSILAEEFHKVVHTTKPIVSKFELSNWSNWGHYLKELITLPIAIVDLELTSKVDRLNGNIKNNCQILNDYFIHDASSHTSNGSESLLKLLSTETNTTETGFGPNSKYDILSSSPIVAMFNGYLSLIGTIDSQSTPPPSWLTRHWPVVLVALFWGPSTITSAYQNRYYILEWITKNIVDSVYGFITNWVVTPIKQMVGILQNDTNDMISILSKETLASDLDSLERMFIDYLHDQGEAVNINEVHQMVKNGDMTLIMSDYEQNIRSPLRSMVKGTLVRSLLIQLQKTKVDGALAISGIDKLIKSQQLVFGVVSIAPSMLIIYQVWNWLRNSESRKLIFVNGKQLNLVVVKCLNNIENCIYEGNDGELFVEVMNLVLLDNGQPNHYIPKLLQLDWITDLTGLTTTDKYPTKQDKLLLMNKIWNVYGGYLR
ncbi:Nuclear control of ATPase protein 2 [Scheffersomyces spartinae]|uniref:Nuclear control of ATPase protein 2 n=1 Tax=Scheffersomyces spartinae TaxID=45513 RepID=A0A9P7V9J2_9ASCO|nr:Nuclear control of ATPase protein 2 [Scheffersomyces spartinae]KAG7193714.1 Nuclear control of ATPase protein 2 [Scheffersomyces spartinae]